MKTKRVLFKLLALALCAYALSYSARAQNVQTTDPRITTETGDRVCVAAQKSGSDVGAKVNACDSDLGTSKGEIWLTGGGNISTPIEIRSNHTLRVLSGTYTASTSVQVIRLHDNSTLRCDSWAPVLQESTQTGGNEVFTIVEDFASANRNGDPSANIQVTGCHFKGARSDFNSTPQTVSLGNCHNCSATGNWLENTHTIGIQVGGGNGFGSYAQNVRISDNLLTGVASQNIAVVNAKDVLVSSNKMIKPGQDAPGAPGLIPIDVEPNEGDVLQDIKIIGNVINATESVLAGGGTKVLHGIAIQHNVVDLPPSEQELQNANFGPVLVENNTIVGMTLSDGVRFSQISGAGILFNSAQNVHVRGNHLMRCYDGIKDLGGSSSLTIENNTIQSAGFTGNTSMLLIGTTNSLIRGNLLYSDPRSAFIQGEDTEIDEAGAANNNIFEGNFAESGVTVVGSNSKVVSHSKSSGTTLLTPSIASFVNANHNHTNAAGGGQLGEAALALSDVPTNDVSVSKHGFVPKAPNDVTKFLRGDGTWAVPSAGGTSSGWTDDGSVVRLTTATDSVGVGTSNPVAPFEARGTGSFGGDVLSGAGSLATPFGGIGQVQNLVPNSETIGGTGWDIGNGVTATQNFTTAPDGNVTASKLICGGVNSGSTSYAVGTASGGAYTFSFWAKAGNSARIQYGIYDFSTLTWVTFVTVTDLDSNWRRLIVTGTPTAGHTVRVYIYPDTAGGAANNYNYVWGAQVTGSGSAGVYARTAGSQVSTFNGGVISGRLGIGTTAPTSKLQVTGGDVYVNTIGNGLILKSSNGSCFRITVSDAGVLSASSVTCP